MLSQTATSECSPKRTARIGRPPTCLATLCRPSNPSTAPPFPATQGGNYTCGRRYRPHRTQRASLKRRSGRGVEECRKYNVLARVHHSVAARRWVARARRACPDCRRNTSGLARSRCPTSWPSPSECLVKIPRDAWLLTAPLVADRPSNILEWHFVITGPEDSPFENGQYHGKLVFPSEYPYKPPAIMMFTPKCVPASSRVPVAHAAHDHCAAYLAVAVDDSTQTRACASP